MVSADIEDLVTKLTVKFLETEQRTTAQALVAHGWSTGRAAAAAASGEVIGAEYSAILDGRTCAFCRSLDGLEVVIDSPEYQNYSPPQHGGCRCQWIYIHGNDPNFRPTEDVRREVFAGADVGEIVQRFAHANEMLQSEFAQEVAAARKRILERKTERLEKRIERLKREARAETAITDEERAAREKRREAARKAAETRARKVPQPSPEAVKQYEELADPWFESLSQDEKEATSRTKRPTNIAIQAHLEGQALPDHVRAMVDDLVPSIDSALKNGRLTQELTVYRGFAYDMPLTVGDEIPRKQYTSSSLSPEVATSYAKYYGKTKPYAYLARIVLPPGLDVGYTDSVRVEARDLEVLIQRGLTLKIKSFMKRKNGVNIIEMEIVDA